jgi:5'-nucleotidase, lipoprotein e(P4) family
MKKAISLCMGFTLLVFATVSCVTTNRQVSSDMQASVTNDFRKESYLNGIAYQLSAEVKGLQIQAFKLARIQLDQRLMERDQGKYARPIAIISDIDDALADDAMYMADIVLREGKWDNGPWDYYYDALATTACKALPGAVEFLQYAKSKGVEVFYITNRDWDQHDLTVQQLKHLGFPYADSAHVQVMNTEGSSNKTERRENVLKTHDVVMYIGDNIGDFTAAFKRELGPVKRTEMALQDEYKNLWGDRWIVLPNATYGDYVGAVWYNDKSADAAKRSQYIKDLLDYYRFSNTKKYSSWYKK